MAAKVGTAPTQFIQGATPVSAYLGATAIARTLYFTGDVDGEWTELGNWFNDVAEASAASSLPTAADSVIATASITSNSDSTPAVVNLTATGSASINISVTVAGVATFNDSSAKSGAYPAIIYGNAVFNDSSTLAFTADINGSATFNDSASCEGTVAGDAIFNGSSSATGANIAGTGIFNDSSCTDAMAQFASTIPDPPPFC